MSARLGIPIPEMIFGDNLVSITHKPTGWSISFNAEDALDRVDKTGERMLRVAYAGEWSSSREKTSAGISEVVKPFDWSYTTDYCGTEKAGSTGGPGAGGAAGEQEKKLHGDEKTPDIPIELLKRRDPILFADEVVLYESELDDNGCSIVSVKLRVMEHRMLLLCRLFMRLDNVLVRVRDTRVYVDFDKEEVIREYTEREDKFENVKTVSFPRTNKETGLRREGLTDLLLLNRNSSCKASNWIRSLSPFVMLTRWRLCCRLSSRESRALSWVLVFRRRRRQHHDSRGKHSSRHKLSLSVLNRPGREEVIEGRT